MDTTGQPDRRGGQVAEDDQHEDHTQGGDPQKWAEEPPFHLVLPTHLYRVEISSKQNLMWGCVMIVRRSFSVRLPCTWDLGPYVEGPGRY